MVELVIDDKTFVINEIRYLDLIKVPEITDGSARLARLFELSGIDGETLKNLTAKQGVIIIDKINELNGLIKDFRKTS